MFGFGRTSEPTDINPQELQQQLQQAEPPFILDVREPSECLEGTIANSRNIPLGQLSMRLKELPTQATIVTVCRSGNRSRAASELLRRSGFKVLNMRGGMIEWSRQRLPMK